MLFNSVEFLVFFPIVFFVYFLISPKVRYIWLLAASYFFYMCWNPKYIILIFLSTAITFASGLMMEKVREKNHNLVWKRFWLRSCLAVSLFFNLLILFYFKYFEFAITNINRIIGIRGGNYWDLKHKIILPVGISFYIFQALGYAIDVYREDIKAEKNFFRYALFVSFFPQLVAGPIERSENLLNQMKNATYFKVENARQGLLTMAYGLFLKVVVADRLAGIINPIYSGWEEQRGMNLMVATILFSFQIYCDFEGYSQIAIGSAKILGFHINRNFMVPYLCTSIRGFWKKWHISLTSWFRDYLYIPLGGNRKGKLKKYLNTLIVFLCSGLWHGANWHFVAWGGLNGIYNIVQDAEQDTFNRICRWFKIDTKAFLWKCLCGLCTFFFINISWVFFRATGIRQSFYILKTIWDDFNIWYLFSDNFYKLFGSSKDLAVTIFSLVIVLFVDILRTQGIDVKAYILRQQFFYRWLVYILIIFIVMIWGGYGSGYEQTQFIYFQF